MRADISAIADRFSDLRIAFVTATDLAIPDERPPALDDKIKAIEADAAVRFRDVAMPQDDRVARPATGGTSPWGITLTI